MNIKIEQVKSSITLLREILIVCGILVLITSPTTIKETLTEAGIKSIAGVEFKDDLKKSEDETKKVANEISVLKDSLDILTAMLDEAINQTTDSETKKELASIQSTIQTTTQKAYNLDDNLRSSLSRQEALINQFDKTANVEKQTGWIFLAKINEAKTEWDVSIPKTILETDLPIESGDLLKISTDTYLRKDTTGQKSTAEILSVVKKGETVEVIKVDFSHARAGGWFMWAKVFR